MVDIYKCEDCSWEGTEDEMGADCVSGGDECDEAWSNWICPGCGMWWNLEDYEIVDR